MYEFSRNRYEEENKSQAFIFWHHQEKRVHPEQVKVAMEDLVEQGLDLLRETKLGLACRDTLV